MKRRLQTAAVSSLVWSQMRCIAAPTMILRHVCSRRLLRRIFSHHTQTGYNFPKLDARAAAMAQYLLRPNTLHKADQQQQVVASASTVSAFRSSLIDAEGFYFGTTKTCRMCRELALVPREHVNIGTHVAHEVLIDALLPFVFNRECDVIDVIAGWSEVLLDSPEFIRIQNSTAFSTFSERVAECRRLLKGLKELGLLNCSLMEPIPPSNVAGRSVAFERIECIGDNTWGSNISARILLLFPQMHKHWLGGTLCGGFNVLRDIVEANANLEKVFDMLDIQSILHPLVRVSSKKFRADVIEAILGDLHLIVWGYAPVSPTAECFTDVMGLGSGKASLCTVAQHVLSELFDVITLAAMYDCCQRILPILGEAAVMGRFESARNHPLMSQCKSRIPMRQRYRTVHHLPVKPMLHAAPQRLPKMVNGVFRTRIVAPRWSSHCVCRRLDDESALDDVLPFIAASPSDALNVDQSTAMPIGNPVKLSDKRSHR